jgi:hypothetical protein
MNTCATCQYFSESSCHRYPPVVASYAESRRDEYSQMSVETYTRSEFPNVLPTEWCGEWRKLNDDDDILTKIIQVKLS